MKDMKNKASKLAITGGKGFRMEFDNGYSLSIQIGPGNYCDNYGGDRGWHVKPPSQYSIESTTCEIAIINPESERIPLPENNDQTVKAYVPVSEIPEWITYASNL